MLGWLLAFMVLHAVQLVLLQIKLNRIARELWLLRKHGRRPAEPNHLHA